MRQFRCRDLLPGQSYQYEVKAEIVRGGKVVTEVQTVVLTAGERGRIAFRFNNLEAQGLAATE